MWIIYEDMGPGERPEVVGWTENEQEAIAWATETGFSVIFVERND